MAIEKLMACLVAFLFFFLCLLSEPTPSKQALRMRQAHFSEIYHLETYVPQTLFTNRDFASAIWVLPHLAWNNSRVNNPQPCKATRCAQT